MSKTPEPTILEGATDFKPKLIKANWSEQIIPERPDHKCEHYFEFVGDFAACTRCTLRLMGVLEIKNGRPVL